VAHAANCAERTRAVAPAERLNLPEMLLDDGDHASGSAIRMLPARELLAQGVCANARARPPRALRRAPDDIAIAVCIIRGAPRSLRTHR